MKRLLLATTAMFALAAAAPAFAAGAAPGGDDSATINQVGEGNASASQHQPGLAGNTALINQSSGFGDSATQEQWRDNNGVDFAVTSQETITQTTNLNASASQEDNGDGGDVQKITQNHTANSSAAQTVDEPFGFTNHQTSSQDTDASSSVSQQIGTNPTSVSQSDNNNTQTATQTGQLSSAISQLIDGGSHDTP